MKQYTCSKYHGLGNDYLVMDPAENSDLPDTEDIRRICDRHYGFGSDGLLIGPLEKAGNTFSLRLYNPDGSEFEKSGNGLRIFARYIHDRGYASSGSFFLKTEQETMAAEILDDKNVRLEIGKADFRSSALPVSGPERIILGEEVLVEDRLMKINCVSVGNPHCVIFRDALDPDEVMEYGPGVENHHIFPRRTNVQFAKVIDRNHIEILIWERGAGYTLASGTSSCAAVSVCRRLGLCSGDVRVSMPGGELSVRVDDAERIYLTGPVEKVFSGTMTLTGH